MEMEIEALATLRLNQSPRRYRTGSRQGNYEDESTPSSPYFLSAPTSPRREVEETPLGEVHAAVPFDWEETPGTPKRGRARTREDEDEGGAASRSPSPLRLSRQSSTSEFDFGSARFLPEESDRAHDHAPFASADQLFLHGQLLPLRLPPRLQAVKHLRRDAGDSFDGSFRMGNSKQHTSFRSRSKSPVGPKLQKFRSLSPLRIFKRESSDVSILFSEKSASGSSASSARSSEFSSSSSGDDTGDVGVPREFWPSFEDKKGKTLHEFLYSDKAPTSPKIDVSKLSSKEVLRKAERFKASEGGLKTVPSEMEKTKALTPQLSRSNARSISRTPILVPQAYEPVLRMSKQKDATSYPKRFGILKRCLGFTPPSPRDS